MAGIFDGGDCRRFAGVGLGAGGPNEGDSIRSGGTEMKRLRMILRALFCRHRERKFVRNIFGDEINWCGGYRSLWRCCGCGKYLHADQTHKGGA
jgi:hypothetical protein